MPQIPFAPAATGGGGVPGSRGSTISTLGDSIASLGNVLSKIAGTKNKTQESNKGFQAAFKEVAEFAPELAAFQRTHIDDSDYDTKLSEFIQGRVTSSKNRNGLGTQDSIEAYDRVVIPHALDKLQKGIAAGFARFEGQQRDNLDANLAELTDTAIQVPFNIGAESPISVAETSLSVAYSVIQTHTQPNKKGFALLSLPAAKKLARKTEDTIAMGRIGNAMTQDPIGFHNAINGEGFRIQRAAFNDQFQVIGFTEERLNRDVITALSEEAELKLARQTKMAAAIAKQQETVNKDAKLIGEREISDAIILGDVGAIARAQAMPAPDGTKMFDATAIEGFYKFRDDVARSESNSLRLRDEDTFAKILRKIEDGKITNSTEVFEPSLALTHDDRVAFASMIRADHERSTGRNWSVHQADKKRNATDIKDLFYVKSIFGGANPALVRMGNDVAKIYYGRVRAEIAKAEARGETFEKVDVNKIGDELVAETREKFDTKLESSLKDIQRVLQPVITEAQESGLTVVEVLDAKLKRKEIPKQEYAVLLGMAKGMARRQAKVGKATTPIQTYMQNDQPGLIGDTGVQSEEEKRIRDLTPAQFLDELNSYTRSGRPPDADE